VLPSDVRSLTRGSTVHMLVRVLCVGGPPILFFIGNLSCSVSVKQKD
jgi:hypothetical protein